MSLNKYFYHDKPLFGLDIGYTTAKVLQITNIGHKQAITGYGVYGFDPNCIKDGVIVDPENLAKSLHELFAQHITGAISTRRVAVGVPATRAFSRSMKLPKLSNKDLLNAVKIETEQYVPIPFEELYMDYTTIKSNDKEVELLAVAIPKKIVDSYATLTKLLGLEAVVFETSISGGARLFVHSEGSEVPTILMDFGSVSTDITIYDRTLVVTGTVPGGGDVFTNMIRKTLGISVEEALIVKSKYGLDASKKQTEIKQALTPGLEELAKEVRRMIRYYEERSGTERKIGQVVTMGGGANMPGLSEYLTEILRLPTKMCNPWQNFDFGHLTPPSNIEKSMFATAAGLALVNPKDAFS